MDIKLFSNIQDTFRYDPVLDKDPMFYTSTQEGMPFLKDSALEGDQRQTARILPNFKIDNIANPLNWGKTPTVFANNNEALTGEAYYNEVSGASSSILTTPEQAAYIRSILNPETNPYRTMEFEPEKFNRSYLASLQDDLDVLKTNPRSEENDKKIAEKIHEFSVISSQLKMSETELAIIKQDDAIRTKIILDASDGWASELASGIIADLPWFGSGYDEGKDVFTKDRADIDRILNQEDPNFDGIAWFNQTFKDETVRAGLAQYGLTEAVFAGVKNVNRAKVITANALMNTEMQRKIGQYNSTLSGWKWFQNGTLNLAYTIFNNTDTVELALDTAALAIASAGMKLIGAVLTATGVAAGVGVPTLAGSVTVDAATASRAIVLASRFKKILGYSLEAAPKFILNDVPSFGKAWGLGAKAAWMVGGGAVYSATASLSTQKQNIAISELTNFTSPGAQRELSYSLMASEALMGGVFTGVISTGLTLVGAGLNKLNKNWFVESGRTVGRTVDYWKNRGIKNPQVVSETMPPVERAVAAATAEGREATPADVVEEIAATNRVATAREIGGSSTAADSAPTNPAINQGPAEPLQSVVERAVRSNSLRTYQDAQRLAMASTGETDFSKLAPKEQAQVLVNTQRVLFLAEREAIKQGNGAIDPQLAKYFDNSRKQLKANIAGVRKNFTPEQRKIFETALKAAATSEKRFRYALKKNKLFGELFDKLAIDIPDIKPGKKFKEVTKLLTVPEVAQAIRVGNVQLGVAAIRDTLYRLASIVDTIEDRIRVLNEKRLAVAKKFATSPELNARLEVIDDAIAKATVDLNKANAALEGNSVAAKQLLVELEAREPAMTAAMLDKAKEVADRIREALDSAETKGPEQAEQALQEIISETVPAEDVEEVAETVLASRMLDGEQQTYNMLSEIVGAKPTSVIAKLKRSMNAARANFNKATRAAKREIYTGDNTKEIFVRHAVSFWGNKAEEIANKLHDRFYIFVKAGMLNDKEFRFFLAVMLDMPLNSERVGYLSTKIQKLQNTILGSYDPVSHRITISSQNKKEVLNTILHEFGHSLEGTNFLTQKLISKAYNETSLDSILASINTMRTVLGIERLATEYSVSDKHEAFAELFSMFLLIENKAQLDYIEKTVDRSITSLLIQVANQAYNLVANTIRDLGIETVSLTYSQTISDVIKAVSKNTNNKLNGEFTTVLAFVDLLTANAESQLETTEELLSSFIETKFKASKAQAKKLAALSSKIVDKVNGVGVLEPAEGKLDASYTYALLTTIEELKTKKFTDTEFTTKFIENFKIYNQTETKQVNRFIANQMKIVDAVLTSKGLSLASKKKVITVLNTLLKNLSDENAVYDYIRKSDTLFTGVGGAFTDEVKDLLRKTLTKEDELGDISQAISSAVISSQYTKGFILQADFRASSLASRAKLVYGLQKEINKRITPRTKKKFTGVANMGLFDELSFGEQQEALGILESNIDNGLTLDHLLDFLGATGKERDALKAQLKTPEEALVYLSDRSDIDLEKSVVKLFFGEADEKTIETAKTVSIKPKTISQDDIDEIVDLVDEYGPGFFESRAAPEPVEGVPTQAQLKEPSYQSLVIGVESKLKRGLIFSIIKKKDANTADEIRQNVLMELLTQQKLKEDGTKDVKTQLQEYILSLVAKTDLTEEQKIDLAFKAVKKKLQSFAREEIRKEKEAQLGGPVKDTREVVDRDRAISETTERTTAQQRVDLFSKLKFVWEPVRSEDEMFNSDVFNTILNAELNGVKFFELFPEFSLTKEMSASERELFAKLNDRDTLVAIAAKKLKEGLTDGKENPTVKDYVTLVFGETDPAKIATLERKIKAVKQKAKNQIQAAVEVWGRVSDGSQMLQNAVDIELSSRNTKPLVVKEQAAVVASLAAEEPKPTPKVADEVAPAPVVVDESTIPMPYKLTDKVTEETLHVVGPWDGSGEVPIGSMLVTRIDGGISKNTKPGSNVVSVNIKTENPLTLRYNTKNGTLSVEGDMKNKKKFLSGIGIEKNVKHMLLVNIQSTYESLVNNIEKISGLGYDAVRIIDETGRVRAVMLTTPQKPEVVRVFKIEEPVVKVPTITPETPALKPTTKPEVKPAPAPVEPVIKDLSEAVTVVHKTTPAPTPLDPGVPKMPIRVPEEKPPVTVVETKAVDALPPEEELAEVVRDKVGNRNRGIDANEIIALVKEAGKLFKAAKNKLGYALSEADFMTVRNRMLDMYVQVNEYITNMNEQLFGSDFRTANELFWTKVDNILYERQLKAADTNTGALIDMRSVYKQAAAEVSKAYKKEFVAPMTFSEFKSRQIKVVKTDTGNNIEFTFNVSKERQKILDAVNAEGGVPDPVNIPEPEARPVVERTPTTATPATTPTTTTPRTVPEVVETPLDLTPKQPTPLREALREVVARESPSHLARENFNLIAFLFGGSERATANWYRRLMNKTTGLTQISSGLANTIRSFSAVVRHVSRFADNTRLQTGTFVAPGQEAGITWREAHSYAINALHGIIQATSSLRSYVQSIGPENMAALERTLAINRFSNRPVTAADVVAAVPDIAGFTAHGRRLSKGKINPAKVAELLNNLNLENTRLYKRILDLQVETGNMQIVDDLGIAVDPENYFPILFDADKLIKNKEMRNQLVAALMKARQRTKLNSPALDTNTMVALGWIEVEAVQGTTLTRDRKILGIRVATDRFDAETLSRLNPRKNLKSGISDLNRLKKQLSQEGFMYAETPDAIISYEIPKTVKQLSDADKAKYFATINGSVKHYADTELVRGLFKGKSVVQIEMEHLIDFKTFDGDYRDFGKSPLVARSRPHLSVTTRDGNFLLDVQNITPDEVMTEPLVAAYVKTNPLEVANLFSKGRLFELIVQKELMKKYGIKGMTMQTYLKEMEAIASEDLKELARTNTRVQAKQDALQASITNGFTRLYEEYASYTGALRTLDSQADVGKLTKIAQDIIRFKTAWMYGLASMAVETVTEFIRRPIYAIGDLLNGINYLIGPKRFKMDAILKSEVGDMAFVIDDLQTDLGNRYLSDVYDGPLSTDSPLSKIIQRNAEGRTSVTGSLANFATEVGSLSAVDRFNRSLGKTRITRQFVEDLRAGRLTKLLAALQDPAVASDLQRLFNLSGESPREARLLVKRWKGIARQAGFPYDPTRAAVYNQYGLLDPEFVKALKYLIDRSGSTDGRINFNILERLAYAAPDDAPVSREKLFSALDRFRYYTEDMITKQTASRQAGLNRFLGVGSRTVFGKLVETLTGWVSSFQDNVILDYTNRNPMKYLADTILLAGGLGTIYSFLREILAGRDVSDVVEEVKDNPTAFAVRMVKEANFLGIGNAMIEIPLSVLSELVGGTWKKYGGIGVSPGLDVLDTAARDFIKISQGVGDVLEGKPAIGAAKMLSPLIAPPVNKGFTAVGVKGMEMMLNLERTNQLQIFLDTLRTSKKAPYTRTGVMVAPTPVQAPKVKPKTYYERKEQYIKSKVTAPTMDVLNSPIQGVSSNLADLLGKPKRT